MKYAIIESTDAPSFRGKLQTLWDSKHHEVIVSGPYDTGKTFAALSKLHALLCVHPKSNALMVRQTRNSILTSAVITYEKKVLPFPPSDPRCPIKKYGGEHVEFYAYPNGSKLWVGGLDDADKYLSAEYDFIYVNQAEEITLDSWEKLVGRATGRAGNAPWTQVFGDCNPGPPNHWIKSRPALQLLETRHEDNPSLHDGHDWTEAGRKRLAVLDGLTGLRYKRGRLGLWVGVEGVVYEFDSTVHLIKRFEIPEHWQRIRVIDFGYVNPFVCLWLAIDEDGRLYLYRQLYMTQRTVARHMVDIHLYSRGERYTATISDHDAEDRATLAAKTIVDDESLVKKLIAAGFPTNGHKQVVLPGIHTTNADKRITVGIEKVQERLKLQGDNRPRLFVMEDSLIEIDETLKDAYKPYCTEDEFSVYAYPEGKDGKPVKEEPVKVYDHGMDALRYGVVWMDAQQPNLQVVAKSAVLYGTRETSFNRQIGQHGSRYAPERSGGVYGSRP
jgi:phage terminase large subunit